MCLLPWYYVFNAEYPKEPRGHSKTMSGQSLPIGVENFISMSFQSLCVSPIYIITNKPDLTKYYLLVKSTKIILGEFRLFLPIQLTYFN